MKKNNNPKPTDDREKTLYHNTEVLLKKYRDVAWSGDASVMRAKTNFQFEFSSTIEEFLDMSYAAGADLTGTKLEEQMRCVEKNQKMLRVCPGFV